MCEGRGGAEGWDARVDERTMSRSRDMTGSKAPLIASGSQQGARATAMLQGGSSPFDFCMCTGTKLEEFFAPNLKKHNC